MRLYISTSFQCKMDTTLTFLDIPVINSCCYIAPSIPLCFLHI